MFDAVRNNKKISQVFLALITLPFAFWGLDSYVKNAGGQGELATVDGIAITQPEFDNALREQQDRLRASLGENYSPALVESVDFRRAVLERLINQRLLAMATVKGNMTVPDKSLQDTILGIGAFQKDGKFSPAQYESVLRAQGMSQTVFESRLRSDLSFQQVLGAVSEASLVSRASAERLMAVQMEERSVSEVQLPGTAQLSAVKLAEGAAQKFYDANRARFELPARARLEYVLLSQDAVAGQVNVSDAELRKEYDAHVADRYQQPEERRASHILIAIDKGADAAAVKAAQDKAEALLKQVKANPADFPRLAKDNSQDPGSAGQGGDLGFFGKGMMDKAFEAATFNLSKEGEISALVRSDYGFHIIRLTGLKPAKQRSFDEVKGEIAAELRRTEAKRKLADAAEGFGNTVYEQADSLKPVAEKYKLNIQTTDWIVRDPKGVKQPEPFGNEKLLAAVFGDDAVKNKRNTDAIDVGNGQLVSARVLEYKPAALRPFEEVKAQIEQMLTQEEAVKLAEKDGQAKLAALAKGEALPLTWGPARTLVRSAPGFSNEARRSIFQAAVDKLPAYAGATTPGMGYTLYRIDKVNHPSVAADDPNLKALQQQYAKIVAEQDFAGYLAALRKRYNVKVNTSALEGPKDKP
jgi:peptidyl-prolyl cis-trans isomerase D